MRGMITIAISKVSAIAATTHTCTRRRKTDVVNERWASIRRHSVGINSALDSGSPQASRYSDQRASSFFSIRSILHLSPTARRLLPLSISRSAFRLLRSSLMRLVGFEHPLPRPEQPYFQGVFANMIYLFEFLERQPFHFLQCKQDPVLFRDLFQE